MKERVSSDVVALCSFLGPVSVVSVVSALTNRENKAWRYLNLDIKCVSIHVKVENLPDISL